LAEVPITDIAFAFPGVAVPSQVSNEVKQTIDRGLSKTTFTCVSKHLQLGSDKLIKSAF
jgi:hypothetical protein